MPVGIGIGRGEGPRSGTTRTLRFTGPESFHLGALWLAAAIPTLATLLLIVRLAS
ncbi:hypothetical protein GOFOIKOB_3421 [Methylobacterium tardum]|jgi:hypothetical protein|uniref:Uncharacterized protein n=1 Tax=Methylobacterium tardum TaxID=374432 RepID=A0AA37TEL5_9HYPH|nr:hypothetical protein [Methylobacterium tardum]URD34911.1 hypothetical protein M6G65_20390 [Methylobacterium tardum]GJE50374.1 hypothetical protein GOFOIKOB_3421 [Methylobacterium tardum]GLS71795.1 hypothetical protein GCM10007890_38080 [Methylobacterium tardum]